MKRSKKNRTIGSISGLNGMAPLHHASPSLKSPGRLFQHTGSAIVITLMVLVIVTVMVVGIFSVLQLERITSSSILEKERANSLCQAAADHAVALIRGATTAAEAAPSGTTSRFWASQPGRITVFNFDGTVDTANSVNLFSTSNISGVDTGTVDLNRPSFSGKYPVASKNSVTFSSGSAPTMNVQWINVLQDGTAQPSASNQIIGRYAFWVDDELTKINVNTADGTAKSGASSTATGTNSFGFGTPTEVDMRALVGGSNIINFSGSSMSVAQAIATQSGAHYVPGFSTRPFNDPSEIQQVTGVPSSFYSDNNFNLTAWGRAPELNIFGEPKIYLMPTTSGPLPLTPPNILLANLALGSYVTYNGTSSIIYNQSGGWPVPPGTIAISDTYSAVVTESSTSQVATHLVTQIYPTSGTMSVTVSPTGNQLPGFQFSALAGTTPMTGTTNLPQYVNYTSSLSTSSEPSNYALGYRIARYLSGTNSRGYPINWPRIPGASPTATNFLQKYTSRQIDSIVLQLLDTMDHGYLADHSRLECIPTLMAHGFISHQLVCGASNLPQFTEIRVTFSTTQGSATVSGSTYNYPLLSIKILCEAYMPKEYKSKNIHDGLGNRDLTWYWGIGGNIGGWLNCQDTPIWRSSISTVPQYIINSSGSFTVTGPTPACWFVEPGNAANGTAKGGSSLGGFWQDNLLRITDANNPNPNTNYAGFDLFGNDPGLPDPDPRAAECHPYAAETDRTAPYFGKIMGSGPRQFGGNDTVVSGTERRNPSTAWPALSMAGIQGSEWTAGEYHTVQSSNSGFSYKGKPGVTSLKVSGGLTLWTHTASGPIPFDITPLDSMHGPGNPPTYPAVSGTTAGSTNNSSSNPWGGQGLVDSTQSNDTPDPTDNPITNTNFRNRVLAAVIPINIPNLPVPGSVTVCLQVVDPLVNKFPSDWIVTSPQSTIDTTAGTTAKVSTTLTSPPANKGFNGTTTEHGDPGGFWMPEQNLSIPKSQRFPNTGYLQYIRTGMMPDPSYEPSDSRYVSNNLPRGTPFRMFNFSPAGDASQQTIGGLKYPDWAMLDLFTVPACYQPPYTGLVPTPQLLFTWGGATSGRLNPNSALVSGSNYPFSFSRTIPLQGLLRNLKVSTSYNNNVQVDSSINEAALATAINNYVAALQDGNGNSRPLMLPGEICNSGTVSSFVYSNSNVTSGTNQRNSASRNDLVRQIVGNLSTRSNTFTVWSVGQTVKKRSSNALFYDRFEPGDQVLGESRMKFVVERYIDCGVDGVPGNAFNRGTDTIYATPDDTIDTSYNPSLSYPLRYKYRILSATQVNNQ